MSVIGEVPISKIPLLVHHVKKKQKPVSKGFHVCEDLRPSCTHFVMLICFPDEVAQYCVLMKFKFPGKKQIFLRKLPVGHIHLYILFFNGRSFRCAIKNKRWFPAS